MEYRALIEKLDWKGDVVRTVKKYDDSGFKPDMTCFFREAIETGEIKTNKFPVPDWTWDHSLSGLIRTIASAKSQYCFEETEPGLRKIVGEFYPALDAQFVLVDKTSNFSNSKWIKTDRDIFKGVDDGV